MLETDTNPLRSRADRIPFAHVTPQHVRDGVMAAVETAERELAALLAGPQAPAAREYATTVVPLDDLIERVRRVYGYAYHLTTVRSSPELRAAFADVQPRYKRFLAHVASHPDLYRALQIVAAAPASAQLDPLRRRHLDKLLRGLRRSGAALDAEARARVTELQVELAQLGTRFSEHLLDATQAYQLDLDHEGDLEGLPAAVRERARSQARAAGVGGWRFTLQAPSSLPFLRHSRRRDLRERLWRAFNARADGGPFDNRPLVRRILALRRELAHLLGYPDFAAYALEERMVGSVERARGFLETLEERTRPYFEREVTELRAFARDQLGLATLEPWDVRFVFERMRERRFELDEDALRAYFPLPRVQAGMFQLAGDLFGVRFHEVEAPERWHPDVRCYQVVDEEGVQLGTFYTDWYPRNDKRDGAWMNGLVDGGPRPDGGFDPHVGVMCGNVTPGSDGRPALLDFAEVQTLFHEFGHLLHQLLTRVEVRARGQGAVAWDFIELPSQLLENWTYEPAVLARFARHVDSGEPIPDALVARLVRARHFMEPWAQMRQLAFAALDLGLHVDDDRASVEDPFDLAQTLMAPFEIAPHFVPRGFLCGFAHVMAGAYAAGYYAYKWSEVLDADAFTRFREAGLFDRETGRAFVETVLARGDAADASELYLAFMGREPRVDALIERNLGPALVAAD